MSASTDLSGTDAVVGPPLLSASDVWVTFSIKNGMFRRSSQLHAVRGVSLDVADGRSIGLVGESGSGKSTMGRALLHLVPVQRGTIRFSGHDLTGRSEREIRPLRRDLQMVFQDPYSSLDPSSVVGEIVGEPLRVHTSMSRSERWTAVGDVLEKVGLPAASARRYSYEFSGGQRQRIAIARAIVTRPKLLVLDEAVSALDVSTQNQVLELLVGLREELDLGMLFISHNLSVVRWIADWTAVMYLGEIVEEGPTERIYEQPAHPYTRSLLSASLVPDPHVERRRERIVLQGDAPDPTSPPSGCAFRTRCPQAHERCAAEAPLPIEVADGGWAACHLLDPTG